MTKFTILKWGDYYGLNKRVKCKHMYPLIRNGVLFSHKKEWKPAIWIIMEIIMLSEPN